MALMQIDSDNKQEGEIVLKYMKAMMDANRTFMCSVVAPIGKGKSWSCLRWAELWYAHYHKTSTFPKENICFSIEQLLQRLNDGGENKLKKGDMLILEEAGVNAGNKKFMSKVNLAINYVLQSFRSLNIILLLNVPYVSFVDKSIRMLQSCIFEIDKVDKSAGKTYIKPYFIQVNQWSGKVYKKWLRLKDKRTSKIIKVTRVCINRPSKEIVDVYEPMKEKFVRDTIQKGLDDVNIQKNADKPKIKPLKLLTERQQGVYDLMCKGMTSTGEIARTLKIRDEKVSFAKVGIRNKGYFITNNAEIGGMS